MQERIGYLLKRPVGRPPIEVRRYYANFSYQAQSWKTPRRVVAKVEWHPGELYPRVGFIVTNLSRPAERVVAFYNQRGTAEQWIKEGKNAIKWTRLSCCSFAANAVRLQLHALAYNLANFMRTLALPEAVKHWSLTSLREKLVKIGAKVVTPCPLRHLPDGRGRGAEGIVPGNPAADRRTATKTGPSVGTGTVGRIITTGGVCLNDEEKGQIGGSNVVRDGRKRREHWQPACGYRGTPPSAIVYAVPEFIWGMFAYVNAKLTDSTANRKCPQKEGEHSTADRASC